MVSRRLRSLRRSLGLDDRQPAQPPAPPPPPPEPPQAEPAQPAAAAPEPEPAPAPVPPEASPPQAVPEVGVAPATIHKGAYVVVRLYFEGDQPPAQDFARTSVDAARAVVEAGIAAHATMLGVTIKKIDVDDDPPDADEEEDDNGKR